MDDDDIRSVARQAYAGATSTLNDQIRQTLFKFAGNGAHSSAAYPIAIERICSSAFERGAVAASDAICDLMSYRAAEFTQHLRTVLQAEGDALEARFQASLLPPPHNGRPIERLKLMLRERIDTSIGQAESRLRVVASSPKSIALKPKPWWRKATEALLDRIWALILLVLTVALGVIFSFDAVRLFFGRLFGLEQ